jgi:hypothetical protein
MEFHVGYAAGCMLLSCLEKGAPSMRYGLFEKKVGHNMTSTYCNHSRQSKINFHLGRRQVWTLESITAPNLTIYGLKGFLNYLTWWILVPFHVRPYWKFAQARHAHGHLLLSHSKYNFREEFKKKRSHHHSPIVIVLCQQLGQV